MTNKSKDSIYFWNKVVKKVSSQGFILVYLITLVRNFQKDHQLRHLSDRGFMSEWLEESLSSVKGCRKVTKEIPWSDENKIELSGSNFFRKPDMTLLAVLLEVSQISTQDLRSSTWVIKMFLVTSLAQALLHRLLSLARLPESWLSKLIHAAQVVAFLWSVPDRCVLYKSLYLINRI